MQNAELCSNSGGREHLGTLGDNLGTLGDQLGALGGPSTALWRSQGPKYEKPLFFVGFQGVQGVPRDPRGRLHGGEGRWFLGAGGSPPVL